MDLSTTRPLSNTSCLCKDPPAASEEALVYQQTPWCQDILLLFQKNIRETVRKKDYEMSFLNPFLSLCFYFFFSFLFFSCPSSVLTSLLQRKLLFFPADTSTGCYPPLLVWGAPLHSGPVRGRDNSAHRLLSGSFGQSSISDWLSVKTGPSKLSQIPQVLTYFAPSSISQ